MIEIKLKELRESLNMNKKEFAQYLGLKYTTYNGYETASREPASDFLILVSDKLNVSIDYLLGVKDKRDAAHSYQLKPSEYSFIEKYRALDEYGKETINIILDRESTRTRKLEAELTVRSVPTRIFAYYGKIAAAGTNYGFDDVIAGTKEYPLSDLNQYADYTIGVSGNSMEPTYHDGDIVYVKRTSHLNTGDIGIFQKNNGIYIKEVGEDALLSHNENYKPMTGGDVMCLGKVLGLAE